MAATSLFGPAPTTTASTMQTTLVEGRNERQAGAIRLLGGATATRRAGGPAGGRRRRHMGCWCASTIHMSGWVRASRVAMVRAKGPGIVT